MSQKRGKAEQPPAEAEVKQKARDLLYAHYRDFGPTLAHEKLVEEEGLKISDESVRQLMIAEGLWKPEAGKGGGAPDAGAAGVFWGAGADRWLGSCLVRGAWTALHAAGVYR